jgi:hypothetical protein
MSVLSIKIDNKKQTKSKNKQSMLPKNLRMSNGNGAFQHITRVLLSIFLLIQKEKKVIFLKNSKERA